MRQVAKAKLILFVLLIFSAYGCADKNEIKYIKQKYPKPNIAAPAIEYKCETVKCVLSNYQKMKDYAMALEFAMLEMIE